MSARKPETPESESEPEPASAAGAAPESAGAGEAAEAESVEAEAEGARGLEAQGGGLARLAAMFRPSRLRHERCSESENRGIGASGVFPSTLRLLDYPILCAERHSKTL